MTGSGLWVSFFSQESAAKITSFEAESRGGSRVAQKWSLKASGGARVG